MGVFDPKSIIQCVVHRSQAQAVELKALFVARNIRRRPAKSYPTAVRKGLADTQATSVGGSVSAAASALRQQAASFRQSQSSTHGKR